jgi:hypothetical protein
MAASGMKEGRRPLVGVGSRLVAPDGEQAGLAPPAASQNANAASQFANLLGLTSGMAFV